MTFIIAVIATIALINGATAAEPAPAAPACEVPEWVISGEGDLARVTTANNQRHPREISVVGSGSSALSGPDGAHFAYPARLEEALKELLPSSEIKVNAHVQARLTTADMAASLEKIVADDKPDLVIWQAGTV